MKHRVLIVDDDPEVRRAVRRGLQLRGYHVFQAVDGCQGASKIQREGPFDVVLSDMDMPKADGLDFWLELRRCGDPHASRFIFHTTNFAPLRALPVPVVKSKSCIDSIEAAIRSL